MGSLLGKIREMQENGTIPKFDPTNFMDVLMLARTKGLRQQVMYTAMDMVREDSSLSNPQAILKAAKHWKVI